MRTFETWEEVKKYCMKNRCQLWWEIDGVKRMYYKKGTYNTFTNAPKKGIEISSTLDLEGLK